MKILIEGIGAFLLLIVSILVFIAYFGQEITVWLHGAPPPEGQVRRDLLQGSELSASPTQADVKIRSISIAEHEGQWIRMRADFDAIAEVDVTIKIGKKAIPLKGGITAMGGEASLEYRRDTAAGEWKLIHVTLDREPRSK